jgi:hypothetical protein
MPGYFSQVLWTNGRHETLVSVLVSARLSCAVKFSAPPRASPGGKR